ncbi:hypothetical protein D3C84_133010 [compost metagenome]
MYRNDAPRMSPSNPSPAAHGRVPSTPDLYEEYEELFQQMEGGSPRIAQQQPVHQQPAHQRPAHQQPAHQRPAHQRPAHQQPAHQQPAHQQPAHQQPTDCPARQQHLMPPKQVASERLQQQAHQGEYQGITEQANNSRNSKYREFYSFKVHGSKAALNFVPDETRKQFLTVSLEAAELQNKATRTYNWKNKSRVQLTRGEFLEVVAVLLGIGADCQCKFDNHGTPGGAKKGFQMIHQGNKVFVSVFEANKPPRSVPIPLMEATQIAHMMLSIYVDNYPGLTTDTVLTSLILATRKRDSMARSVANEPA